MTIYERIRYLREKQGLSQQDLAEKVGYKTASAVNKIELGLRDLNQTKIALFAKALGVKPSYLMDGDEKDAKGVKIPVLGTVPAGIPIEAIEEILDYEEIPVKMAQGGEYFALQIKGDSMEPKMSEGDVVIIRKQEDCDNGDVAIVMVNGNEATVKKIKKFDGGINLIPFNNDFDVFTFSNKQIEELPVRIIGKVVELRAKY